jgi:hypothetical protein
METSLKAKRCEVALCTELTQDKIHGGGGGLLRA